MKDYINYSDYLRYGSKYSREYLEAKAELIRRKYFQDLNNFELVNAEKGMQYRLKDEIITRAEQEFRVKLIPTGEVDYSGLAMYAVKRS